jgi:very-short-patch-repair endonuclease
MRHQVPSGHRGFAKAMRRNPTDAERRLWSILRAGRLEGLKFKRQQPIAGYIVDFVCLELKLIVEADGSQHAEPEADTTRDAALTALGYRVLRFWNNDILTNPDGVARMILASAVERK